MFVLHEHARLLKSSGSYVQARETKIGMRLINGAGKSVEIVDVINTHVPIRRNNKSAFHVMRHLGWPSQIKVYDKNPVLTDRGLIHITDDALQNGANASSVMCPSDIDWDSPSPQAPETFDMGYVLGAFYAGHQHPDPDEDQAPVLRAYNHHHMMRLMHHLEAALPPFHAPGTTADHHVLDEKTHRISISNRSAALFKGVQHSTDFPETYITTQNSAYATGLYMGMMHQMRASGIVHENIYRALVLALILSKQMQSDNTHTPRLPHIQFPLSSVKQDAPHHRVRVARVLKLDDPNKGLLCDNLVIYPACNEIAFTH